MYKLSLKLIKLKLLFLVMIILGNFFCFCTYGLDIPDNERGKKVKIAIITAMQSEFDAVNSLYQFSGSATEKTAEVYGKEILLIKSGMGKVNAAIATEKAYQAGADLVINTGLAGGIDAALEQGDIVVAEKVCYHDVWCGEPNAKGQVQDLPLYYPAPEKIVKEIIRLNPSFKLGLTVTGDQFVTDGKILNEIKQNFPEAYAVDMESAAVAQTCYLHQLPYISVRIISDVVGKEGQMDQYNNFWKNMPTQAADMLDKILKAIPAEK